MALPVPGKVSLKTSSAELGDRIFVVGGKLLLLLLLGVAVLMPLLAIFWRGFSAEDGQGGGWVAARELVTSDNFHWLVGNSLKVSLSVAAIVVPLAYLFAYALQRTMIPGKRIWRGLSLLPLMAPSMLPGIALVYLFGNQGMLRGLICDNIYGFWGIVLGPVLMIVIVTTISVYLVVYKDAPLETLLPPDDEREKPKWRWPWQRAKPTAVTGEPGPPARPVDAAALGTDTARDEPGNRAAGD